MDTFNFKPLREHAQDAAIKLLDLPIVKEMRWDYVTVSYPAEDEDYAQCIITTLIEKGISGAAIRKEKFWPQIKICGKIRSGYIAQKIYDNEFTGTELLIIAASTHIKTRQMRAMYSHILCSRRDTPAFALTIDASLSCMRSLKEHFSDIHNAGITSIVTGDTSESKQSGYLMDDIPV